jgi:hypothetical protein
VAADFINFKDIDVTRPESWQGKKIVSFDIDWAVDKAIEECLALVTSSGIKATFFVTHSSPVVNKLKNEKGIELGIHPNFDGLINKDPDSKNSDEIIKELKSFIPSAQVIRSHGMTHSGRWLPLYKNNELKFSSQYFMNGVNTIQPFSHLNGVVEVPVYFADDGFIWESDHKGWDVNLERFSFKGIEDYLCVYNFHPIHIALNTHSFDFYNSTRESHKEYSKIKEVQNKTHPGSRDLLELLISKK